MKVFISHSSVDREVAGAFAELLRSALRLSAKDIRCTSVDGYKLPAGTNSDDQLRQEVHEVDVFIALLSEASMKSVYVMFELGARWGAGKYLAPIMVRGLEPSLLKAPLSSIHAISGTSQGDLHQLLGDIAKKVGAEAEQPQAYLKALETFIAAAKNPSAVR